MSSAKCIATITATADAVGATSGVAGTVAEGIDGYFGGRMCSSMDFHREDHATVRARR